ncbi:MAG TPA: SRPBCC family protein [Acidimicrobiales bacterium]|nr:SRPBCC family protein [Acidimicrobiales bacterium]
MEADRRAPVHETGEIFVDARPEIVWDTLTDLASWPRWMPGVKAMQVEQPAGVGTRFRWRAGPGTIRSEILESDRPRSVGWKGRTLGIDALHAWRMEEQTGGCYVSTEESWRGALARMLPGVMRKAVRRALDDGLPALKEEAERRAGPET